MANILDIDRLLTDNPDSKRGQRLKGLIETSKFLKDEIDEMTKKRKEATEELEGVIDKFELDGIVSQDLIVTKVKSKSAGIWDKTFLVKTLTPQQLEEAFTEGQGYAYIKVERNLERAESLRE